MVNKQNDNDFELKMIKRKLFKLMFGAIIFSICMFVILSFFNGFHQVTNDYDKEQTKAIANELGIKTEDVIIESHLLSSDIAFTSKGNYKVEFKTKNDKLRVKSMVKVSN